MRIEVIEFALIGGAHGAADAAHHSRVIERLLSAQLGELAVTGLKDALQSAGAVAIIDRALKQVVQITTAPKIALEFLGANARVTNREAFAKNPVPRHQRHHHQQHHDQLNDQAGVDDQFKYGQILGHVHRSALNFS